MIDDANISELVMQSAHDLLQDTDKNHTTDESGSFSISQEALPAAIETILFAFGEAISLERISGILETDSDSIKSALSKLMNELSNNPRRGIMIRQIEDSYILSTKPEMRQIIERMYLPRNRPAMTQAAYETLAIIAYNQPVTRSQVESVRGVSSDSIISRLAERNLISDCGNLDAPGRPTLFETTDLFLKEFGLSSVKDLPPMDMIMYKTLRDIENSVAEAAGIKHDGQMTIEQLVSAIKPTNADSANTDNVSVSKNTSDEHISDNTFMDISGAFFGENSDNDTDNETDTK